MASGMIPDIWTKKLAESFMYGQEVSDNYHDEILFLRGVIREYMKEHYESVFEDVAAKMFSPINLASLAALSSTLTVVAAIVCNIHDRQVIKEVQITNFNPNRNRGESRVILVDYLEAMMPDIMYDLLWDQDSEKDND